MQDEATVRVWDLGVRLFHWSLVAFFVIAYLTGDDDEGGFASVHAWSGYVIIGLLAFRLVWGLVGNRYARFSDFIYSPSNIIVYVKQLFGGHPKRYLGHNPLGGLMVVVMLLALVAVSWTGLKAYQAEGKGPLAAADKLVISLAQADDDGDDSNARGRHGEREGDEFWEEAHEASVNVMLFLIVLHLGGVAAASLQHRENLPRAMVTGRKRRGEN